MDQKIEDLKKKISELEKEIDKVKTGKNQEKKVTLKQKSFAKKIVPKKELFRWSAPSRVFVHRSKLWFLLVTTAALLMILFFAFLQEFMIILVICVGVLILFLLASVPPGNVEHIITNKGIDSIDQLYKWESLKEFWVCEKLGKKVVYISTKMKFPGKLVLLVSDKEELKVVDLISDYLDYKDYPKKEGWLSKKSDGVMIKPEHYLAQLNNRKS